MMYSGQEFASPQEALEHHGVKGMRWGIRREESSGSAPSSASARKPTRSEIKSARSAVKTQKAAVKTQKQVSKAEIEAAKQRLKQAKDDYKTMPERDIARHRTLGEKMAIGVLTLGAGVAIASLASRSGGSSNKNSPYNIPKGQFLQRESNISRNIGRRESGLSRSVARRNANVIPPGFQPGYLANVGEQVSVSWR